MEKELRLSSSESVVGKNWGETRGKVWEDSGREHQGKEADNLEARLVFFFSQVSPPYGCPWGGRDGENEHFLRAYWGPGSGIITIYFIPYSNHLDWILRLMLSVVRLPAQANTAGGKQNTFWIQDYLTPEPWFCAYNWAPRELCCVHSSFLLG